jgi:CxxC-x17-CxxC domain-containing protein
VKKRFGRKNLLDASQDEPGVAGLINKVQQQLSAIENKLDILISGSSKRPFEKNYSQQPSRRFDHPHRHDRGPREMHKATCAECNKECEIPFKPSGDRPVYCRDCFAKRKKSNLFNANRDNRPEKRQKPVRMKKSFFARRKKRA